MCGQASTSLAWPHFITADVGLIVWTRILFCPFLFETHPQQNASDIMNSMPLSCFCRNCWGWFCWCAACEQISAVFVVCDDKYNKHVRTIESFTYQWCAAWAYPFYNKWRSIDRSVITRGSIANASELVVQIDRSTHNFSTVQGKLV